jgi:hypothetical protein
MSRRLEEGTHKEVITPQRIRHLPVIQNREYCTRFGEFSRVCLQAQKSRFASRFEQNSVCALSPGTPANTSRRG